MLTIDMNLGSGDNSIVKKVIDMIYESIGRPAADPTTLEVSISISERELGETHLNIELSPGMVLPKDYDPDESYTLLATYDDYKKETSLRRMIKKEENKA